jgi:SAM-dependent methyltransferase
VDPETTDKLIRINREFYQQFAVEFDRTRARLQPGVEKLADGIAAAKRILDLGCGNGGLWLRLRERGFSGSYTGLDFSPALVQIAGFRAGEGSGAEFWLRDLAAEGWEAGLDGPYDRFLAFAVFHHLPPAIVEGVLHRCRRLIAPDGMLLLSVWQFLRSPRWRLRVQLWEMAGIDSGSVVEDYYLLDWRSGGTGYRYVHDYSSDALSEMAGKTGFTVADSSLSDGREGDLSLYQIWEPAGG